MKHSIALLWLAVLFAGSVESPAAEAEPQAQPLYVSPKGSDENAGTQDRPFGTIRRAVMTARQHRKQTGGAVTICLADGTYYLDQTLVLTAEDSGTEAHPLIIEATDGGKPVVSGGRKLVLNWQHHASNVWKAAVPADVAFDQLFVNGVRQHMARYPNYDPNVRHFNGYAPDAFSKERAANWKNPAGGYMHAMHRNMWGDFHYVITGKDDDGKLTYEGGWQNNRRYGMHAKYRMVENIFEELDAAGEWYLDSKEHMLYFMPPTNVNLEDAKIEIVRLRHLIEFRGSQAAPVRWICLKGITFRHAERTFMDNNEPLLRSDWTIYRGGAVLFEGAEDCAVIDCTFDQLGGNAVFASNYNRRICVRGCHIRETGANGIAFVGDPNAVRSGLFEYNERQTYAKMDKEPGPKSDAYPADCTVDDCLIYLSGRVEKQTAGVQISMSRGITVRHCSIYDVPRAGINISERTWGGHLIEYCDVFDTVKETGDHGSFNSWGRDRFWKLTDLNLDSNDVWADHNELPLLDAVDRTVLRNNRWRCDHGWDIDLDDGSSNYHIYNNLCLRGGIKNREGFYRIVENNITVNNGFHPHVWYKYSEDIVRRNIFFIERYRPAGGMPETPWGKQMDYNLVHEAGAKPRPAVKMQQQSQRDTHSIVVDARFVNPAAGDYRVKDGSPALVLGFENFPMDEFGVVNPALRELARTPRLPDNVAASPAAVDPNNKVQNWFGAEVRNVAGLGDRSAYGLEDESGVIILKVPAGSPAAKLGLQEDDVIVGFNGKKLESIEQLTAYLASVKDKEPATLEFMRGQDRRKATIQGEQ